MCGLRELGRRKVFYSAIDEAIQADREGESESDAIGDWQGKEPVGEDAAATVRLVEQDRHQPAGRNRLIGDSRQASDAHTLKKVPV